MKSIVIPAAVEQLIDLLGDLQPGQELTLLNFKWWDGTVADHKVRLATSDDYRDRQRESSDILRKATAQDLPPSIPQEHAEQALNELRASYEKNLSASKTDAGAGKGPAYEQVAGSLYRLHGNLYLLRCVSLDIKPLTSQPKRADAVARAAVSEFLNLPTTRWLHVVKLTEDYMSGVSVG